MPLIHVAVLYCVPTLTVIANNQSWLAVRQSALDVYPDGAAAKANVMPLTELKPAPDYEKVIELSPEAAIGYNGLAEVYLQDREYEQALGYGKKALELEPDGRATRHTPDWPRPWDPCVGKRP